MENNYIGEPKLACGVQEHEDARTSHPCERRACHCKATCGGGRGKSESRGNLLSQGFEVQTPNPNFARCVMSSEKRVKAEPCAGTFNGCLVEYDPERNARQRKIKRCAILISVALQTAGLAVFLIAPLFAKPAELTERIAVPIPPYSRRAAPRNSTRPATDRTITQVCVVCPWARVRPVVSTGRAIDPLELADPEVDTIGPENPDAPLSGIARRSQPRRPDDPPPAKRRIHEQQIDPALLTRRIEPVFPAPARQLRKSGRVELHAIIATDGSVQSLEVVSGDPLFVNSALEAVRQWHYKPTYLNGQPVEIDTYITVIYTLQ